MKMCLYIYIYIYIYYNFQKVSTSVSAIPSRYFLGIGSIPTFAVSHTSNLDAALLQRGRLTPQEGAWPACPLSQADSLLTPQTSSAVLHFQMDQQWIPILATLLFYNKLTAGVGIDVKSKEEQRIEMKCRPSDIGSMITWFRVVDKSGMEFLASFSNNGMAKSESKSFSSIFSDLRIREDILILKSFDKGRDSGIYSCASLKNNELIFGDVTRLLTEKMEAVSQAPVPPTDKRKLAITTLPCACLNVTKHGESMLCNPIILIPLAGSCGLLLLFILIIVVYCNRVRTRRCPHHYYKKRPQKKTAPGKQQQPHA
ncbi:T-cell surface glycoprotein CD8 alpha chain [Festucalex cinctus]